MATIIVSGVSSSSFWCYAAADPTPTAGAATTAAVDADAATAAADAATAAVDVVTTTIPAANRYIPQSGALRRPALRLVQGATSQQRPYPAINLLMDFLHSAQHPVLRAMDHAPSALSDDFSGIFLTTP